MSSSTPRTGTCGILTLPPEIRSTIVNHCVSALWIHVDDAGRLTTSVPWGLLGASRLLRDETLQSMERESIAIHLVDGQLGEWKARTLPKHFREQIRYVTLQSDRIKSDISLTIFPNLECFCFVGHQVHDSLLLPGSEMSNLPWVSNALVAVAVGRRDIEQRVQELARDPTTMSQSQAGDDIVNRTLLEEMNTPTRKYKVLAEVIWDTNGDGSALKPFLLDWDARAQVDAPPAFLLNRPRDRVAVWQD